MTIGLRLDLAEYEHNDVEKGDYLALTATASHHGFAGHTLFWAGLHHLEGFIDELDALDTSLHGRAQLRCGWGDDVLFELAIEPQGHSGRLRASIDIASDSSRAEPSRLVTTFVLLPNALTSFRRALACIIKEESSGPAELEIDPDAAV